MTEVFKGGSLGQGTAVVPHFDIDLVIYSRSEPKCGIVFIKSCIAIKYRPQSTKCCQRWLRNIF